MQPSWFSCVAPFVAESWSLGFNTQVALFIGVVIAMLLVPHVLAAKMLAPNPTLGRVVGAALIHVLFAVVAVLAEVFSSGIAPVVLIFGALVLLVVYGLLAGGIYGFSAGRGILYGVVVVIISTVLSLVVEKTFSGKDGMFASLLEELRRKQRAETRARPDAAPTFVDTREAQAAAMERYPDLAKPGSRFNQRFLDKHRAYKAQNSPLLSSPDWPWIVATEVAAELKVP